MTNRVLQSFPNPLPYPMGSLKPCHQASLRAELTSLRGAHFKLLLQQARLVLILRDYLSAEFLDHLAPVGDHLDRDLLQALRFERPDPRDYLLRPSGQSRPHEALLDILLLARAQVDQMTFVHFEVAPIDGRLLFRHVLIAIAFPQLVQRG